MADARIPCPWCAELVLPSAVLCPHCSRKLLVSVRVEGAASSDGAAYHAAKALVSARHLDAPIAQLRRLLRKQGTLLEQGMTREAAGQMVELLTQHGVPSAVVNDAPEQGGGRLRLVLPVALALSLTAVAVIVYILFFQGGRGRPPAEGATTVVLPERRASAADARDPGAAPSKELSVSAIAKLGTKSTVSVRCGASQGAGFLIDKQVVVTNAHVLCSDLGQLKVVDLRQRAHQASVMERDDKLDLALLRAPGLAGTPLVLGDAARLNAGDRVVVIGSPYGLGHSITQGIVSHTRRSFFGVAYLQFDAAVNPGNSGGPLIDGLGRVVGVVSRRVRNNSGLGLALPINYLYDKHPEYRPGGSSAAAWKTVLGQVARVDRDKAAEARATLKRPGLAAARVWRRPPALLVLVLQRSEGRPQARVLRFQIRRGGRLLCEVSGAPKWSSRPRPLLGRVRDRQAQAWLKKQRVNMEAYFGKVMPQIDHCPDLPKLVGTELTLLGGEPQLRRTVIF